MKWLILVLTLAGIIWAGQPKKISPLPFDSAARTVGEVARALGGKGRGMLDPYPELFAPFLKLLRYLPRSQRLAVINFGMAHTIGVSLAELRKFNVEEFFASYTRRYPEREYQAMILGSPGGGIAHLASLLDSPALPVCALIGVRHRIEPDDLLAYLKTGQAAANALVQDSQLEAIIHYDPIHDRDLVSHAALVRVRLLHLPKVYRDFIRKNLAPGGSIVLAEGTYLWPQIHVQDEVWLQIGGLGGISAEDYLRSYPVPREPTVRRESEWGCPDAFAQDVRTFAKQEGYQLIEIPAAHPTMYSELAFRAYRAAGAREGVVLLDCFTSLDAAFCKKTGIAPLHLPFLTRDSMSFARNFLARHPVERQFLLLHFTYALPPDMAQLTEWEEALPGVEVLVDRRFWPDDPYAPFATVHALSQLEAEYRLPVPLFLSVEKFLAVISGKK